MDLDEIKKLIKLLSQTDVAEIEVEKEGRRVRIKMDKQPPAPPPPPASIENPQAPVATQPSNTGITATGPAAAKQDDSQRLTTVTAPLVGVFYRAPSPEAESFVEVGSKVKKGQTLCIIEAMKLLNEIESEVDGVVAKVVADNARPVEYGEPLFLIDPA